MTAYCLWNVRAVHDPAAMADYVAKVPPTVAQFGGEYLVVGGPLEPVEGEWRPDYPVLIRFPSMASARAWYDSPEYSALREQRLRATSGDAVFMDSSGVTEHLAPKPDAPSRRAH